MSSLHHDVIKIEFIQLGYLPNYPYHLISDKEMFDAFLNISTSSEDDQLDIDYSSIVLGDCFFKDYYPCPSEDYRLDYNRLIFYMHLHIQSYLTSKAIVEEASKFQDEYLYVQDGDISNVSEIHQVPDWVYSYMLKSCIGPNSSEQDIGYLLQLLNLDVSILEFTDAVYSSCYKLSNKLVGDQLYDREDMRAPTIFGEPNVVKALRLLQSDPSSMYE